VIFWNPGGELRRVAASTVNWYCVRLTRSSMVRSCTGLHVEREPSTFFSRSAGAGSTSTAAGVGASSGFRLSAGGRV